MRTSSRAALVLVLAAAAWAEAPGTEIPGSVTARREGAVRVSFEPRADVAPAVGDAAAFKALIQGIEVDAGRGEVVEVEPAAVWVQVSSGRPGLGNQAVIRATGRPAPKKEPTPARVAPAAGIAPVVAPAPPTALGLVRHDLDGIGRVWLPGHARPRVLEPAPYWKLAAEGEGRAAGKLQVEARADLRITGDRELEINVHSANVHAAALRPSTALFRDRTGRLVDDPALRWKKRTIATPIDCFWDSYDAGLKDPKKAVRLWGVVCFPDHPKIYYRFLFLGRIADVEEATDGAVEWIIRSFQPEPAPAAP